MNPDPRLADDSETVVFEADLHGQPVRIEVSREAIEDRKRAETMTPTDRLEFVNRNQRQIIENVRAYTRSAADLTGIRITSDQLAHCD